MPEPLKSETRRIPVPIPNELALELSTAVAKRRGQTIVTDANGWPVVSWALERAIRKARARRNASAMTTLNTYGHMWPDADESARAAKTAPTAARADSSASGHMCP